MKRLNRFWIWMLAVPAIFSCNKQPSTRFELLDPEKTGITFVNLIEETDSFNILKDEYMYNGGGVGIGDLNNDGLSDIILTGNKVSTEIYLNRGDFSFENITSYFSGLDNKQWISGVSVVDINGDGKLDVYMTSTSGKDPEKRRNKLWINQGSDENGIPRFEEKAAEYGIDDPGYSVHSAFLDYDLDGDLDLYVLNNTVNKDVPTNYRPKIVDGSSMNNDRFYENNGDGTFTDVTLQAGIVIEGFGLGIAVADINKDGYPDVYVSNDYISNDLMYINQGDKTFLNNSEKYLSYQSKFSMGNDISDINNDGNPDIITLDMMPKEYARKKQTMAGSSYLFYVNDDKYGYQHQYIRNMLQVHNGFLDNEMIPYSEVGQMAGVFDTEWSWSPLFADYDNDGDKDLIITNGFPKDLTDKDFTNYKAQMYNYLASEKQILSRIPEVKVSNFTYERTGEFEFKDVTEEWGMKIPSYSNGAAYADLDNDGDLDYIVNNIDDPAFIYKNHTIDGEKREGNFLNLRLKGSGTNTQAIGAKVELWAGGQYQYYEHFLTRGYISSVDPKIHFGLKESSIDSVRIIWPGNRFSTTLKDIEPNTVLEIDESTAQKIPYTRKDNSQDYLFRRANMIDYTHDQEDYIDFFDHQSVMPHKFSQIGPCIAMGDLNNDGVDDLLVGASDKLPTTVYVWGIDGFQPAEIAGLSGNKSCTEADLIIMDIDNDNDNDVIAISGGYRNQYHDEYKHYVYINNNGVFEQKQLPLPAFPASVIRPMDFDHDGDLDLFVGSRVTRDYFPFADPSYVVINDNGSFSAPKELSFNLGMVTDARWTDIDGDGWEDLIITREWNSVALLRNEAGKGFKMDVPEVLNKKHGAWASVITGDFDNDGDEDYIVGNLGNNHRFTVSEEYPMRIYAVDLDNNGTIDPITSAYWKDKSGVMREYPVNGMDELASQSPFFRKRFNNYTQFSYATMDSIVNKNTLRDENVFTVNTTTSYVLWNDNGTFEWEPLPVELQLAPIRKMLVMDVNNDGHLDVIVTGNDYSYDVSTGYYDAGKGQIMLGKEGRGWKVLSPAESGMLINGQVDDLEYYETDSTSYLIAGVNRRKIQMFVHKK